MMNKLEKRRWIALLSMLKYKGNQMFKDNVIVYEYSKKGRKTYTFTYHQLISSPLRNKYFDIIHFPQKEMYMLALLQGGKIYEKENIVDALNNRCKHTWKHDTVKKWSRVYTS